MEIVTVKKVRNGWAGLDSFGEVVEVATTEEQLVDMLNIVVPQPKIPVDNIPICLRFDDEGAMARMFANIKRGEKIQAIKEMRSLFYAENRVNKVSIGLREAKDIVEAIAQYVPRDEKVLA